MDDSRVVMTPRDGAARKKMKTENRGQRTEKIRLSGAPVISLERRAHEGRCLLCSLFSVLPPHAASRRGSGALSASSATATSAAVAWRRAGSLRVSWWMIAASAED